MKNSTIATALATLAVLALLVATPALAQPRGRCATADVPWSVAMPDGSVQEPGLVKICHSHSLNPVTALLEVRVGSTQVGRFHGRVALSEGLSSHQPIIVLEADQSGQHRLVGYAWPHRDVMHTFVLYDSRQVDAVLMARASLFDARDESVRIVLVGARPE